MNEHIEQKTKHLAFEVLSPAISADPGAPNWAGWYEYQRAEMTADRYQREANESAQSEEGVDQ